MSAKFCYDCTSSSANNNGWKPSRQSSYHHKKLETDHIKQWHLYSCGIEAISCFEVIRTPLSHHLEWGLIRDSLVHNFLYDWTKSLVCCMHNTGSMLVVSTADKCPTIVITSPASIISFQDLDLSQIYPFIEDRKWKCLGEACPVVEWYRLMVMVMMWQLWWHATSCVYSCWRTLAEQQWHSTALTQNNLFLCVPLYDHSRILSTLIGISIKLHCLHFS